jgi:Protein of unknown function (DUF2585)
LIWIKNPADVADGHSGYNRRPSRLMTMKRLRLTRTSRLVPWLTGAAIVLVAAAALAWMGRTPICTCGSVKAWHGVVLSSENSQHLSDWYTFSHVIHGFLFYALLRPFARRASLGARLAVALAIECGWEVFENTDYVINRYREVTIALDYHGDSIVNSLSDVAAMVAGFVLAARFPLWATVMLAIALELFVGWYIRDNLTLNVLMLLYPIEAVRQWQSGV